MTQQHMDALARANVVRMARAEIKRKIKTGETNVADVLRDVPAEIEAMPIADLLAAQHRWGEHSASRVMKGLRIGPAVTVGRLTPRQRSALITSLEGGRSAFRTHAERIALQEWAAHRDRKWAA